MHDPVAVQTSGSGDILALDLVTEDASIELSGSGKLELIATGCATVTVLGSGDVHLAGDPRICDFDRVGSGQLVME